jgi:signal transduction histidine kinase
VEDLSLHLLDIAENSLKAGARRISISVEENKTSNTLKLTIEDNGRGMDEETCRKALSPFYSTKKTTPYGLGLPLLAQAAEETGGALSLESEKGRGTKVVVVFNTAHIDMKPLGDIERTVITLQLSHPEVEFEFFYTEL